MDFTAMREAAWDRVGGLAWAYIEATADDDVPRDAESASRDADPAGPDADEWQHLDLVPAVLTGADVPDTTLVLPEAVHRGGARLASPILISPTAAHGLAHRDGEGATGAGAFDAGALMVYSSSATVDVTSFGRDMRAPFWAQVYLHRDRAGSDEYLDRAVAAGAGAIVLTVDLPAPASAAPFRGRVQRRLETRHGNYPDLSWAELSDRYEYRLTCGDIGAVATRTGLPVLVKGVLRPDDALRAVDAGAAGVIVSNHGRRNLAAVVPAARVLQSIVDAVAGQVPVLVDGGIRSGVDALRALACGATAVGVGRPMLWALATDGRQGVADTLRTLTAELARAMTAVGAGTLADIDRHMVDRRG